MSKGGVGTHLVYHGDGVEEHQGASRRKHLHHALPRVGERLDAAERGALRGARQLRAQRRGERLRRHAQIVVVDVLLVLVRVWVRVRVRVRARASLEG